MILRRSSGVTTSRCMPRLSTPAKARRSNQPSSSGGSHCAWIGRSTAAFTASGALAQDGRAAIAAGRRAGGHHHVLDAIEFDRRARDFGKLSGRLALDGPALPQATGRWRRTGRSSCGSDSGCRSAGPWLRERRGRAASRCGNRGRRPRSSDHRIAAAPGSGLRRPPSRRAGCGSRPRNWVSR